MGTKKYHYIHAPTGLIGIFVKEGSADTMYHVLTDHLGSLTTVINAETNQLQRYSYSSWGLPRDPDDWTRRYTGELFAGRGFTGHEHLQAFDLINMNGRVYDPVLASFLSPDPFVQFPGAVNGFNRYSYVMNNPLIFTDPSGYMPDWVQDEYDHYYRNGGGDDRRNEGGGGWNPFGWISRSMNIGGWTKNPGDYWHYSPVSGTYYNSETGERRQANNESTKSVLNDAGFEVNDNIEEGATASFYLFLGMGSYQDNKTALRQDILGNYEVWLPLFTATYGGYFTQMITANGGDQIGGIKDNLSLFRYGMRSEFESLPINTFIGRFKLTNQITQSKGNGPIKITQTNTGSKIFTLGYSFTGQVNIRPQKFSLSYSFAGFNTGVSLNNGVTFTTGYFVPTSFDGQTTGYSLSYTPNLNAIAIAATLYVVPYLAPVLAF